MENAENQQITGGENLNMGNLEYIASNLYAGGWRAEDRDAIKREYDFTPEEIGEICRLLTEYERREVD